MLTDWEYILVLCNVDSLLRQQYEEQAAKNRGLEEELKSLKEELAEQREHRGRSPFINGMH